MADAAPSKYLDTQEVAERLDVAPRTVRRWCRLGQIDALRFGKLWRIPVSALCTSPPRADEKAASA